MRVHLVSFTGFLVEKICLLHEQLNEGCNLISIYREWPEKFY